MNREESIRWAEGVVKQLNESPDKKYIVHRQSRPIFNLKQMFESSVALYGDNVAFRQRFVKGEAFGTVTYKEALSQVQALGTVLVNMGLKGKRIALIGQNCYQWALSYLTIVGGLGVAVPLDKELGANELSQLCENSEASAVIYSSKYEEVFSNLKDSGNTKLEVLVNMDNLDPLIEKGKELIAAGDRTYLDAEIDPEEMGILLFTSGTTGLAKGVMLSQKNICFDLMIAPTLLEVRSDDIFFSILPLHHTYECTCGFLMPIYKGASIAYCEGLRYIQKNLKEIEPTMFLGVPLVFEKLYKGIWNNIRKNGQEEKVKKLLSLCGKLGPLGIKIQKKLLAPIYEVFGSRLRNIISGGAAMDSNILDFFNSLGYIALQGYGLTECAPMAALCPDDHKKLITASVGHLMPCMQARIDNPDEDGVGEICLKGDNIMMGYYNMPEETAKVIKDGWFHTGDLGYIDSNNFIYITGRAKNVIITANGKNVFPEELEFCLSNILYIEESMVWADKDEKGNDTVIVATIYPNVAAFRDEFGEYSKEKAMEELQAQIDEINKDLPLFKKIRHIYIREEEFEKTTGHKIKRFVEANKSK